MFSPFNLKPVRFSLFSVLIFVFFNLNVVAISSRRQTLSVGHQAVDNVGVQSEPETKQRSQPEYRSSVILTRVCDVTHLRPIKRGRPVKL